MVFENPFFQLYQGELDGRKVSMLSYEREYFVATAQVASPVEIRHYEWTNTRTGEVETLFDGMPGGGDIQILSDGTIIKSWPEDQRGYHISVVLEDKITQYELFYPNGRKEWRTYRDGKRIYQPEYATFGHTLFGWSPTNKVDHAKWGAVTKLSIIQAGIGMQKYFNERFIYGETRDGTIVPLSSAAISKEKELESWLEASPQYKRQK